MGENQLIVPEIPEAVKNKKFGASDIKWVKTVNDKVTHTAYLPPDNPYHRVVTNSDGVFFCLQLNPRFTDTLNAVPFKDLILLYQRLNPGNIKCFTHLVTPIGNTVVPSPYGPNSVWPGRWVKVIAMTGTQVENSISFGDTLWSGAGFSGHWQDLGFMAGKCREIPPIQQLSALQNEIWGRFQQGGWLKQSRRA
jgi:hypothetical protein